MSIVDILALAAGLSMDALAAAVCKGLAIKKVSAWSMLTVGGYFGVFQGGMPLLCYFIFKRISDGYIGTERLSSITPWVAFVLLSLIGINMIKESARRTHKEKEGSGQLGVCSMLALAFATSIDAFLAGITFLYMSISEVLFCTALISLTTFTICFIGTKAGAVFGSRLKSKAELTGGIVLISLGLKFLLKDALRLI